MVLLKTLYRETKGIEMRLVAGGDGLDNRVAWVHMVENLEISCFLQGEEIVFITGIGLRENNSLLNLIVGVWRKNASGVVINIGPYIHHIPADVIAFCNKHGFPLFEVPWSVRMAEIMRIFCTQITKMDDEKIKINTAIKNAIFFPLQKDLYVPLLEQMGFSEYLSYCTSIVQLLKINGEVENHKNIEKTRSWVEALLFNYSSKSKVVVVEEYIIIVFVDLKENTIREIVEKIVGKVIEFCNGKEGVLVGVGLSNSGMKCISEGYHQAKKILVLQQNAKRYSGSIFYADLGMYKLLLGIDDKEILHNYYKDTLAKLIQYDQINGTNYVVLLNLYLLNNGSVKKVAQELYIHRNTVNYKINKIEEILACDLSDLETRVIYRLAYIVRELI